MRLTRYTDYALRVLLYLGTNDDRLISIAEIAQAHDISQNHLMKVVNGLSRDGFIQTVRGRGGGLRLATDPANIRIGTVVRHTEDDLQLADCLNCIIAPACGLTGVLSEGVNAMLEVFDRYTLADLLFSGKQMNKLLTA